MATIEERAKEFAEREYYTNRFERERLSFGYYHGATEQQAIDIERACDLFADCMNDAVNNGVLSSDYARHNIETFRKYLTEQ